MRDRQRFARVRDFQQRVAWDPAGVRKLHAGGEIVAIHPMADEHDLLARIDVMPESCVGVDGYWFVGGDVVLLRIHTKRADSVRTRNLYARRAQRGMKHVNLVAVVEEPFITSGVLERVAQAFLQVGWVPAGLGDALRPLVSVPSPPSES